MQPNTNYAYPFNPNLYYSWFNPYMHQTQEYYSYLNYPYTVNANQSYRPPSPNKLVERTCQPIIKIQEGSQSPQPEKSQVVGKKKSKKQKINSKKQSAKTVIKEQNQIYAHPVKKVHHKVKYFDPSSAPSVTSAQYNLVEEMSKQIKRQQILSKCQWETVNQINFPEQFQNPFIVFKFRRIKKKFKKYIQPKYKQHFLQKNQNSQSDNDEQFSSQIQASQSENNLQIVNNNTAKHQKLSQLQAKTAKKDE